MIQPDIMELMNLVVDGAATPAQRARLDDYLAAHPEARSFYDGLEKLVHRLDRDPVPDPPAELEPRILEAVHQLPVPGPARKEETSAQWLRSLFAPRLRPWSTYGLGLATGLFILAVVVYRQPEFLRGSRDIDPADVSGALTSRVVEPIATIPVDTAEGSVSGSAVIYSRGSDVVVDVRLQSTVPVEWTLSFDDQALALDRIERHGTATSAFAANRGSVQGLHTGEGSVTLVFAGDAGAAKTIALKVLEGGQPVFEGRPAVTR